jgi:hypothetical protein
VNVEWPAPAMVIVLLNAPALIALFVNRLPRYILLSLGTVLFSSREVSNRTGVYLTNLSNWEPIDSRFAMECIKYCTADLAVYIDPGTVFLPYLFPCSK